jgi:hypothetical protein
MQEPKLIIYVITTIWTKKIHQLFTHNEELIFLFFKYSKHKRNKSKEQIKRRRIPFQNMWERSERIQIKARE